MIEHLSDIAGIRIICSFSPDIYRIAEMIARQSDVTVLGGEGLYQESEAERLQELPYGCDDPDLSKAMVGGYEGGDPDTDDSDGFLGKSGTQDLL